MPRSSSSTPLIAGYPSHFVVDGSNIATEGRSAPSLQQLNEAVLAFMEEHPGTLITVVVDATFGHRIDKKEVKEFDAAVANNELVTPPAGAVGRGDAFVLSIAHKAKAGVLSNDSFQEFHGTYDWLFEPRRLIGGKPVPHVGWVFVERSPVRGPKSRAAVKDAKRAENGDVPAPSPGRRPRRGSTSSGSPLASEPMPVPTAPPPGKAAVAAPADAAPAAPSAAAPPAAPAGRSAVNDLVPFLDFVERHPVGTSCTAVIESYSSHGAYARSDAVLVYIPLRLMDDPPPRSARSRLKLGEAVTLVVVGYAPERRSVDAAMPNVALSGAATQPIGSSADEPADAAPKKSRRGSRATKPTDVTAPDATTDGDDAATPPAATPGRRRGRGTARTTDAGEQTAAPSPDVPTEPPTAPAKPAKRSRAGKAAAATAALAVEIAAVPEPTAPAPVKRSRAKKAAAAAPAAPAAPAPAAAEPAPKPAAKRAAKKAAAKPAVAAPAAATAAPAKKAAAKRASKTAKPAARPSAKLLAGERAGEA